MLFDISPPITSALRVWPGDTPPSREVLLDLAAGANLTLSTLRATVHLGAHADAPSHCGPDAPSIERRPLELYLGPCEVVRVAVGRGRRILPSDLPRPVRAERVLLATGSFPDPTDFNTDFAALSVSLVDALASQGVRLVGVDAPSVDLFDDRDLLAHKRMLELDMAILEGLVLAHVPEGSYELIALPLPLVGFEASPVRAVLRTIRAQSG